MTASPTVLTVRTREAADAGRPGCRLWRWVLLDGTTQLAASSLLHPTEEAAADAARVIFGRWLDDIYIDMERPNGSWERLR